jgi:hypothetical protein
LYFWNAGTRAAAPDRRRRLKKYRKAARAMSLHGVGVENNNLWATHEDLSPSEKVGSGNHAIISAIQ